MSDTHILAAIAMYYAVGFAFAIIGRVVTGEKTPPWMYLLLATFWPVIVVVSLLDWFFKAEI